MSKEKAKTAAQHILDDRHGADYYRDTNILSGYLEGALGIPKNKAEQAAKAIQEDRNGANYYEDAEILAGFLDGQSTTGPSQRGWTTALDILSLLARLLGVPA